MQTREALFLDLHPNTETVQAVVERGLSKNPKQLPPSLFYDKRGSELFDQICRLEEYYPTRTEQAILEDNISEIVLRIGASVRLVEYGSGNSSKTQFLIGHLPEVEAYVPIDISRDHLIEARFRLESIFPHLNVLPVCADYDQHIRLNLPPRESTRTVAFFPGSTIGNFEREHACRFLKRVHETIGVGGGLLLGVDLVKNPEVIEKAYNDSDGITAQFNLNMVHHINDRLGTEIDTRGFAHRAVYNEEENRIEMYLDALVDHDIQVGETLFHVQKGEAILTEYSHKYTLMGIEQLASAANFRVDHVWTDPNHYFSLQFLTAV